MKPFTITETNIKELIKEILKLEKELASSNDNAIRTLYPINNRFSEILSSPIELRYKVFYHFNSIFTLFGFVINNTFIKNAEIENIRFLHIKISTAELFQHKGSDVVYLEVRKL